MSHSYDGRNFSGFGPPAYMQENMSQQNLMYENVNSSTYFQNNTFYSYMYPYNQQYIYQDSIYKNAYEEFSNFGVQSLPNSPSEIPVKSIEVVLAHKHGNNSHKNHKAHKSKEEKHKSDNQNSYSESSSGHSHKTHRSHNNENSSYTHKNAEDKTRKRRHSLRVQKKHETTRRRQSFSSLSSFLNSNPPYKQEFPLNYPLKKEKNESPIEETEKIDSLHLNTEPYSEIDKKVDSYLATNFVEEKNDFRKLEKTSSESVPQLSSLFVNENRSSDILSDHNIFVDSDDISDSPLYLSEKVKSSESSKDISPSSSVSLLSEKYSSEEESKDQDKESLQVPITKERKSLDDINLDFLMRKQAKKRTLSEQEGDTGHKSYSVQTTLENHNYNISIIKKSYVSQKRKRRQTFSDILPLPKIKERLNIVLPKLALNDNDKEVEELHAKVNESYSGILLKDERDVLAQKGYEIPEEKASDYSAVNLMEEIETLSNNVNNGQENWNPFIIPSIEVQRESKQQNFDFSNIKEEKFIDKSSVIEEIEDNEEEEEKHCEEEVSNCEVSLPLKKPCVAKHSEIFYINTFVPFFMISVFFILFGKVLILY